MARTPHVVMVAAEPTPSRQLKRREAPVADANDTIKINRAPALTLWAAVVAKRLGFDRDMARTLGQAVAGSSAYAPLKGGYWEESGIDMADKGERRPVPGA